MIDNLTEAISHAREVAKEMRKEEQEWRDKKDFIESNERNPKGIYDLPINQCKECAAEHEQLAEWLEELVERREADTWNVIHTEADLPKEDGFYLTTVEYVESISGKLKRNTAELYFSTVSKSWSECGEDEDSDDDIIAWKPMPKPYTESEAENE